MAKQDDPRGKGRRNEPEDEDAEETRKRADELYDQFERRSEVPYNRPERVDLSGTPFREAPFRLYFVVYKSSSRESEYFIHDPARALGGEVDDVEPLPDEHDKELIRDSSRISTFVINHENTLAARKTFSAVTVDDRGTSSVTIYKES
jgi:hypothetical protein